MPGISEFCLKISQRWITVFIAFLIYLNMYGMRTCLSITITEMALPPNHIKVQFSNDTCLENYKSMNNAYTKHTESPNKNRYNWSERTQGLILSSFYWGFVTTSLFGGMINQKFGSKRTLSLITLCTSTFTLLTPCCTDWGGSTGLIVLRLAMGVAEGIVHPSLISLVAHWIPENERSKAGALFCSAIPLGAIFGILPSGIILGHSDWRMVFYFFGTVGLATLTLIIAFCYNSPSESPFISDEELSYLESTLKNTHSKLPLAPWRCILKSLPVWALILATAGQLYGLAVNSSDMPKYMSGVLKLSVQKNGLVSSIPHLSMCIAGSTFSWIADKVIAKNVASIATVRKIGCALSSIGSSAFLIAASYAGCDGTLVAALLSASLCCVGGIFFSTSINAIDLSPNFAGTIAGMAHGIGNSVAMLAPYGVGVMTPNQTLSEWRAAFWVAFGVTMASSVVFMFYASGEVQEWNDPAFFSRNKRAANEDGVKESVDLLKIPE